MKKILIAAIIFSALFLVAFRLDAPQQSAQYPIDTFSKCVDAGFPVMESYPRQCRADGGELFIEDIGNELDKIDLITVTTPRPRDVISSPLLITGDARGFWFFEGSFPVLVTDEVGTNIGSGIAVAKEDWMSEDFVSFEASITFSVPENATGGTLILQKENPSGLPEYSDELIVPVRFTQ